MSRIRMLGLWPSKPPECAPLGGRRGITLRRQLPKLTIKYLGISRSCPVEMLLPAESLRL